VTAGESEGKGEWVATYTFSKSGRKVVNHITSNFNFLNGKIVNHTDSFNFYKWASQALGIKGTLLGWTGFVKNKVRDGGTRSLYFFMNSRLEN
ncbi:MAG: nuclear transport factor 2 family protein, partial [Bacteroidia bacterium]